MLKENYQNNADATFMVQTRSQSKVKAPMVKTVCKLFEYRGFFKYRGTGDKTHNY